MNANPSSEYVPPSEPVTFTSKFVLASLLVFFLLMGAIVLGEFIGVAYR